MKNLDEITEYNNKHGKLTENITEKNLKLRTNARAG